MSQQANTGRASCGKLRWLRPLILCGTMILFAACGCLVVCLARSSFGAFSGNPGQPVMELPKSRRDFGRVEAGGKLTTHFKVKNTGGRRLILNALSGSCDCLAAGSTELVVPPHATRVLPVILDTKPLQGPVQMTLRFATNDPRRPKIQVVVLAEVIASTNPGSEDPLAPIAAGN